MQPRSSFACDPERSLGRLHAEADRETRGPRNIFQRDRDRIIHSISFRRLRHKTQVFVSPDGDHFRVRLTHSLEVAQIGRTIARTLGLDEDLTEALCLAHDIGHPPFGHAGEDALEDAMAQYGGFDHNAQTLRTLTKLETPYPLWDGLNLSWELLEGLAKHNGPIKNPGWALHAVNSEFDLELDKWPSLEAQVAALADDIAYDNHDIDDGIRAGLLSVDKLMELPFVASRWQAICAHYEGVEHSRLLRELVREQIGAMVNDVIHTTRQNLISNAIVSVDDARAFGNALASFSDEMAAQEKTLKAFMYANLYHHPTQMEAADAARKVVAGLFAAIYDDPSMMGAYWESHLPKAEPHRARHIADYIAGMTDRFALRRFAEIFGNGAVPEALLHV